MVLSFENHLIDPIFFSSDPRLSKKAEESLLVDNQALQFAQVKTDTDNGKRRRERGSSDWKSGSSCQKNEIMVRL